MEFFCIVSRCHTALEVLSTAGLWRSRSSACSWPGNLYLDSDLMMRTHVADCFAVSSCFAVLRQLRSIQRSVSDPVLQSLVALVLTKLDYGSTTLAGLPGVQLDRLQSVLNASACATNLPTSEVWSRVTIVGRGYEKRAFHQYLPFISETMVS